MHRGGADDGSAVALRHHGARRLLRAQEKSLEAHVEILVPILLAEFEEGLARATVGVVDQDVNAAKPFEKGREHRLDLGAVGNIASEELGLAAHGADQAQSFAGIVVVVQVVDPHVAASFGQSQGNAATDAALAAGDEGFFST